MAFLENEMLVRARTERVWDVLTDISKYPAWNPRLQRIEGAFSAGATATLHYASIRPWLPSRFVVDVVVCETLKELRWNGPRNASRHLLRATHYFSLSPRGNGTCLVHGERFSGPAAPLMWMALARTIASNHAAVNEAIRARCEDSPT